MISRATIVTLIAIAHRRARPRAAKTLDKPSCDASQSPNLGPTIVTVNAVSSNPPLIAAKPTDKRRVFQYGRLSFGSYAMSSASMMAAKEDAVLPLPSYFSHRFQRASITHRKPINPERSLPGASNRYLPCSVSWYACGKYHIEPCG